VLGTDVAAPELTAALSAGRETHAWWCVPREAGATLRATAEFLELDALAVEDIIGPREYPKVDTIGETVLIVGAAASFDDAAAALHIEGVSILATRQVLVLVADEGPLSELVPVLQQCAPRLMTEGIAGGIHALIDALVDGYTEALEAMEEATENLTASLFADRPLARADQLRAFRLRQALVHLRKVCTPMQEVTGELARAALRPADEPSSDPVDALLATGTARRFADVADHARHTAEGTNGLRDVLASAFETNLALADVHLNMIMKKLSAWAAIIAVPTLVTGFMGMNVPYPGFGQGPGFAVAFVVMISAVVTLYVLFRRSDWL
jgi:magnesium transporter